MDLAGKRVYISGPMELYAESDYNRGEFDRVKLICERSGAAMVVNPADLADRVASGNMTREQAMRHDLRNLLACDVIVMLDGWDLSERAILEWNVARDTGTEVLTEWDVA